MSNTAFIDHLNELRKVVEAALWEELGRSTWPDSLRTAVEYSLMAGGKRLRPVLVLLANEVCGGRPQDAIPAACALEMVHTYSLIHDDLPSMDDDDFRRGRPTCHKVFGEALAILAGDCLLTWAFETIASASIDADRIVRLTRTLAIAAGGAGMAGGQVLDLEGERGPFANRESRSSEAKNTHNCGLEAGRNSVRRLVNPADPSEIAVEKPSRRQNFGPNDSNRTAETHVEELSRIHKMKTGALIAGALEMGAECGLADESSKARLRHYGHCIGLAFQIADDLLDVTGDQTKLGKKPGRDADLGKLTYPGLLGVENSRIKAHQLMQDACDAVDLFGDRSRWLRDLARFIVERDH